MARSIENVRALLRDLSHNAGIVLDELERQTVVAARFAVRLQRARELAKAAMDGRLKLDVKIDPPSR